MNTKIIFGLLIALVLVSSSFSIAEAHPHANIDLMVSHSHDPDSENYEENFLLHSFDHVILSKVRLLINMIFN